MISAVQILLFCASSLLSLCLHSQEKKYLLEITFLEIVFNGDSAEYGKGKTFTFDTDRETPLTVIDTIGGKVIGAKFTIVTENGQVLLAYELYRQLNFQWSVFTQFAPAEPGTLKPFSAYIPGKPSIKNQDFLEIPDPPFNARLSTAVYVR